MNFAQRGLTLLLVASLTVTQAQAFEVKVSVNGKDCIAPVVSAGKACGGKLISLLENKNLAGHVTLAGLTAMGGLTALLGTASYQMHKEAKTNHREANFLEFCALVSAVGSAVCAAVAIELIYNA